jgi:hypothetical protein
MDRTVQVIQRDTDRYGRMVVDVVLSDGRVLHLQALETMLANITGASGPPLTAAHLGSGVKQAGRWAMATAAPGCGSSIQSDAIAGNRIIEGDSGRPCSWLNWSASAFAT